MARRNPKRSCGRRYSDLNDNSNEIGEENKNKVRTRIFLRRGNRTYQVFDPLREELEKLKSIIPPDLLIKFCAEKFEVNNFVHITRYSVVYSSIRYIEFLKEKIEKFEAGKLERKCYVFL